MPHPDHSSMNPASKANIQAVTSRIRPASLVRQLVWAPYVDPATDQLYEVRLDAPGGSPVDPQESRAGWSCQGEDDEWREMSL